MGAAFVHACFQLSVSVLTLLSSHTIGRRLPNRRLLSLSFWYILGVVAAITLLVLGSGSLLRFIAARDTELAVNLSLVIAPVVALMVVLFYYRRGSGTRLWLPRPAAEYISTRAKKTKSSVEAFSLGTSTVFAELPFAVAPLLFVGYTVQAFPGDMWLRLAMVYAMFVALPLIFVAFYLSSGHKLSIVQRWRESAKTFLQWTSAGTLLLLAVYLFTLRSGSL